MKKYKNYIVLLFVFIIIIFLVLRVLSFSFVLKMSGYSIEGINIFEHSYDQNNDEFKIISTPYENNDIAIVHLVKNKLGFWNITNS